MVRRVAIAGMLRARIRDGLRLRRRQARAALVLFLQAATVVVPKIAMTAVALLSTSAITITIVVTVALIICATRGQTAIVAAAIFVVVAVFVGRFRRLLQLLLQRIIRDSQVVDGLEVRRERFQGLVFEHFSDLNVLCLVKTVIAHIEPLHMQSGQWIGDVALGQEL